MPGDDNHILKEQPMQKKIANHNHRSRNRSLWRKDLRDPLREESRCTDRMRMRYASPGTPPNQEWCAGGRAVQLLIENPGMIDLEHPELGGAAAVGWALDTGCAETGHSEYPHAVTAVTDVNLSAFRNFYDLIEQAYGVDEKTMLEIEGASDGGVPMRQIARMIPRSE